MNVLMTFLIARLALRLAEEGNYGLYFHCCCFLIPTLVGLEFWKWRQHWLEYKEQQ